MTEHDCTTDLAERVRAATARRTPLRIVGGDTKRFLGRDVQGEALVVAGHAGIVNYDPAELVITARAGTPLHDIEALLGSHGQHLPFDPPRFGDDATLGGTVACGLAGPGRASSGPLRDYVLGVRILCGDGRVLRFGGEVMKNVAGYDVARLMAGAFGTLGVLLEVSIKVLPLPPSQLTLVQQASQREALQRLAVHSRSALPLTASCWTDGRLHLRFAGTPATLHEVAARIGGARLEDAEAFWRGIREQADGFFASSLPLWRLTIPAATEPLALPGAPLIEWHGMQRWYCAAEGDPAQVAIRCGGFATCFRNPAPGTAPFASPAEPLLRLHRSLKQVFDPAGILNPGRMYQGI
ncbi:MAG: glycolate oxidase subunit GlcE [Steroidobacteraceae bacterium]